MDTNIMILEAAEAEREITKSGVEAAVFVQCLNRCALFLFCFFLQCLVLFLLRSRIRQGFIFMDHICSIMNQINLNSCPEEVAWVAALAEKHKFIKGIVGGLDLTQVIVIWGMARTPDIKWSNSNKKWKYLFQIAQHTSVHLSVKHQYFVTCRKKKNWELKSERRGIYW